MSGAEPKRRTARNTALALVLRVCPLLALLACSSASNEPSPVGTAGAGGLPGQGSGGTGTAGTGDFIGSGLAGNGVGGAVGQPSPVTLNASWDFVQISGDSAMTVNCAATGHSVVFVSVSGPNLESTLRWYETCSDTSTFNPTVRIAPGTYTATFGLLDDVFDTEATPDIPVSVKFEVPMGATEVSIPKAHLAFVRYFFNWTVQKAGAASSCSAVGAEFLAISWARSVVTTTLTTACGQGTFNRLFEPGSYTWKAQLLRSDKSVVATYQPPEPLTVTEASASTLLPFVFDVPAP